MAKVSHASHMMQLGDYKFSVSSAAFSKLSYATEYRWKNQDSQTEGKSPVQQFVGVGAQTITLDGTIYPQLVKDGLSQVDNMRAEAAKGKPLTLGYVKVNGKSDASVGRILGKWIIKSINEERSLFLNDGIPREIQFQMTLERYDGNTK
ncbi:phage tail protein [Pseudoalteromonas sp. MMG022]|uniref:phage tail protein n=1 Tax=Pseudoalteromonas sp. MMG022 TaxID=2909978 RepID=UPI001F204B74|nr:phage tail protein [Pseudoalteromonas sp. MMG022]MCF6435248.1 phage tail protein [Pseudoalteromonas sp. MMG022]